MEWFLEHVVLFWTIFSAIDQVEDLQKDKGVVHVSAKKKLSDASLFILRIYDGGIWINLASVFQKTFSLTVTHLPDIKAFHCHWSEDQNTHNYKEVPNAHTKDLSPNLFSHYFLICVWLTFCNIWKWWFSAESECSKSIHDHIKPKKLDRGEW